MSSSRDEYRLRHMGNLVGSSRRRKDGEQSLIAPPSAASPAPAADGDVGDGEVASSTGFVYVLAFFSALGGFLFGYDTGVVSGAMLLLKKEMDLDNLWQELVVSSTVGAAALSALCGGALNGWLGRRFCILTASFTFSAGGVVLSLAPDKETLLVGRLIVGLGIGEVICTHLLRLCSFRRSKDVVIALFVVCLLLLFCCCFFRGAPMEF